MSDHTVKRLAPLSSFPLTIDVRIPDGRVLTVSAFCARCGWRREVVGHPPGYQAFVGTGARAGARFVAWMNPCGHVDTAEALLAEVAQQCARDGCVLRASDEYEPYCCACCASGCDCC